MEADRRYWMETTMGKSWAGVGPLLKDKAEMKSHPDGKITVKMAAVVAPLMEKVVAAATRMLTMVVIALMLHTVVAAAVRMLTTTMVVLLTVEDLIIEAISLVLKTVVGALLKRLKVPMVVSQMKTTLDRLLDYLGLTCCNRRLGD